MAGLNESFAKAELIVTGPKRKIRVTRRIRGIGLDHGLSLHPGLIRTALRIQPVVDKDQFPVSFRFISQAVFRISPGSLKSNLLPALAVQTVSRAKISMEFKATQLFVQLFDLYVRLSEEVIRRFRRKLPLKLCPDLIGLSEDSFFSCLLGGQLCRRNRPFLCFFAGLFLFLNLLFK